MILFSGGPELIDPAGVPLPQPAQSWVWLVDLERTIALLIGRCLGGMLQGSPVSPEEQDTAYWMKTPLFSDGVEMDTPQLGNVLLCNIYESNTFVFIPPVRFLLLWVC